MKIKNPQKRKKALQERRKKRIRAKICGTAARPRFSVFRSAKHITAQLIDDAAGKTLVAAGDTEVGKLDAGKIKIAEAIGKLITERAKEKGITEVVFDRRGYAYHGRVKAVAEGARAGGLRF